MARATSSAVSPTAKFTDVAASGSPVFAATWPLTADCSGGRRAGAQHEDDGPDDEVAGAEPPRDGERDRDRDADRGDDPTRGQRPRHARPEAEAVHRQRRPGVARDHPDREQRDPEEGYGDALARDQQRAAEAADQVPPPQLPRRAAGRAATSRARDGWRDGAPMSTSRISAPTRTTGPPRTARPARRPRARRCCGSARRRGRRRRRRARAPTAGRGGGRAPPPPIGAAPAAVARRVAHGPTLAHGRATGRGGADLPTVVAARDQPRTTEREVNLYFTALNARRLRRETLPWSGSATGATAHGIDRMSGRDRRRRWTQRPFDCWFTCT